MRKTFVFASLLFIVTLFCVSTQAEEAGQSAAKVDFLTLVDKNADGKVSKAEFIAAMEKKFNSLDVDKSEVVSVEELKVYGEKLPPSDAQKKEKLNLLVAVEKKISKADFIHLFDKRAEQEFSQLDKNQDAKLSAMELGVTQKKRKKSKKAVSEKQLSKAEFIALFEQHASQAFSQLDKTPDNLLTDTELGLAKPKPKSDTTVAVTAKPTAKPKPVAPLTEQQKSVNAMFEGIDANKDGQISHAEKTAAFERFFSRLDTNHDELITADEIIASRYKKRVVANPD